MNIRLKSIIKAHNFISGEYVENIYKAVKKIYTPMAIDYQGKGIVGKLMNYAMNKCKN